MKGELKGTEMVCPLLRALSASLIDKGADYLFLVIEYVCNNKVMSVTTEYVCKQQSYLS